MDKEKVRFYLLDLYDEKNQQHVKNMYIILSTAFATLISNNFLLFPDKPIKNIIFTVGLFVFPFFYFLLRAQYWSARFYQATIVEPSKEKLGTMISIFEETITENIEEIAGTNLYTRFYTSTNVMLVKVLYWFLGPIIVISLLWLLFEVLLSGL